MAVPKSPDEKSPIQQELERKQQLIKFYEKCAALRKHSLLPTQHPAPPGSNPGSAKIFSLYYLVYEQH